MTGISLRFIPAGYARFRLSKIQDGLLEEMRMGNWPITFSIGVLTCNAAPHTTEELVKMADELMYSVKHDRKNSIKYSTSPAKANSADAKSREAD